MFLDAIPNQVAGSPADGAITPSGGELSDVFASNMQKQKEIKYFFLT